MSFGLGGARNPTHNPTIESCLSRRKAMVALAATPALTVPAKSDAFEVGPLDGLYREWQNRQQIAAKAYDPSNEDAFADWVKWSDEPAKKAESINPSSTREFAAKLLLCTFDGGGDDSGHLKPLIDDAKALIG